MNPSSAKTDHPLYYALWGGLRGVTAFPFEHPLEVYKLRAQGSPHLTSTQVVVDLYKARGVLGIFDGAVPNLVRRAVKETYRWPAISILHPFWSSTFRKHFNHEGVGPGIATAVSIVAFESVFILPIERLFVTKVNEDGYRAFFKKQFRTEGVASLYRGFTATFLRHINVWTAFMGSNYYVKREIKKLDPEQKYPLLGTCASYTLIAGCVMIAAHPIDFVRVRIQMEPALQGMRVDRVALRLFKQHGIRGIYSGATFTFIHSIIHAGLTGTLLDRITKNH